MTNDKEKIMNRQDHINHRKVVVNSLFNVLNKEEGRFWLEQYIKKFVNAKEEFYINYLWGSDGFLWNSLSVFSEISITSYEEIKYCFSGMTLVECYGEWILVMCLKLDLIN